MNPSLPVHPHRVSRLRLLLATISVALLVPAGAQATVIDLTGPAGSIRVDGQAEGDAAGAYVANAGDVNGDGKSDFIVGAPSASNNNRLQSGSAYVIYGGQNLAAVDLNNLGRAGFQIDGAAAGDQTGFSVSGGGDLNGDGVDDVIVGAPGAGNNARVSSGSAYVIYGRPTADPPDVDLAKITTTQASRGIRIDGAKTSDEAGSSVALADVNADGHADAIVGAFGASNNGRMASGSVYVVYGGGTPNPGDLDLATITDMNAATPVRGFRIDGAATADEAGWSVAGARDVNGDGVGDVILGASGVRSNSGSAYVIYGQRGTDATYLDLAKITLTSNARGFRIDGTLPDGQAGDGVAGVGDMNGDGVDDVGVGAPYVSINGRPNAGAAYVVYGQRAADVADVDLAKLTATQPARGFEMDGAGAHDLTGYRVGGGGDVNGDGRPDVIVGAPAASNHGMYSGSAYVVYGRAGTETRSLDLATIAGSQASRGVRLDGTRAPSLVGAGVAIADVTGDSRPEAIIGGSSAITNAGYSGAAYVVDLAPPETVIDTAPTVTNDATPTFGFHANEPGSFRCSIDTGSPSFTPCSGPGAAHTSAHLRDGTYTFRVAAVDRAGNIDPTPATRSFKVDTTPPNTTITRRPKRTLTLKPGRRTVRVTFTFASSEPIATFTCRLDSGRFSRCSSPIRVKLARGRHSFSVAAADAAGNWDHSAAGVVITVKAAKPARRSRQ